ncbi:MAG TPA: sn-glycerol-1-phosphate dehydrogenase [Oligoflexia bacterium]|nr:sn-glycerol-1-phosphate dehydrogenase [Oligoflexia bacterium]
MKLPGVFVIPEGVQVQSVVIDDHLDGREVDLVSALGFGPKLAVVSDVDTHRAMAEQVEYALSDKFKIQSVVLPHQPHADDVTLNKLLDVIPAGIDGVIAVGSGTINDLCKMVAFRRGCPQAVFGTAPSMNGYTSINAAITVNGLKKSLHAAEPRGVFLDLSVLAAAPKRLIRSGLGDSLCRPTAQADWLLAHSLFEQTPYNELPFQLLAGDEKDLFSHSRALVGGDLYAMKHLARTLVLSGFGMTLCGGSYPASQGEHLISHYIDMVGGPGLPNTFHGEQIGVTTLAMARIQEKILNSETPPTVRPTRVTRESVIDHFGDPLGHSCWLEFEHKYLDSSKAAALNSKLQNHWPRIRDRIRAVTIPAATLKSVLVSAGAPTEPNDLGWSPALFDNALKHAREIRNRYTFLDFAADTTQEADRV